MIEDISNCAQIVRAGDPERFLTAMTANGADRDALMVLYAFNVEVSRAPWVTAEPMIAEMRLQWWLDAIEEIYSGGDVRRHEVVTPLTELIRRTDLPRVAFDELINVRQWDIYKDPFRDATALDSYLRATSGNLMGLAAQALGGDFTLAADYGAACGAAAWLRAVPALEQAGRYPLIDGTPKGVGEFATLGLKAHKSARSALGAAKPKVRAALRAGWLAQNVLKLAAKKPTAVAAAGLDPSEAGKRLRLMMLAMFNRY